MDGLLFYFGRIIKYTWIPNKNYSIHFTFTKSTYKFFKVTIKYTKIWTNFSFYIQWSLFNRKSWGDIVGGKSPVGVYKRWRRYSFSCFQNNSYRIIKNGRNVDLVDISSVWQFIWQQLTTILLVYYLSILRYLQFNEVRGGDAYRSGCLHPLLKISMFCVLSQNYQHFFMKSNICVIKQIVEGTQKWHWNFSRPSAVFK